MHRFVSGFRILIFAVGFLTVALGATAAEPPDARLDELKREAVEEVEALRKFTQVTVDMIFSFGELGFQEFETSDYVTGLLRENGFEVEMGMSNMPTAWMARWGSGRPVIAFGSDIERHPQSLAKTRRGLSRPHHRGGAGPRRRPQFRASGQRDRRARAEEDHGA